MTDSEKKSLCESCTNCLQSNGVSEKFQVKAGGVTTDYYLLFGSECKLTKCFMFDVEECERFEEKESDVVVVNIADEENLIEVKNEKGEL